MKELAVLLALCMLIGCALTFVAVLFWLIGRIINTIRRP